MQSDTETAEKVTSNEASALLSAEITLIDLKACEEKSVVIMNTPDQNANAVEELVFAMTMTSGFEVADKSTAFIIAHRHKDFIKNTITGAALHDKRVIAVRDKFPDVSNEKMSNEDGCLSRSMTIKACNKIAKETSDVASRCNQHVILHVLDARDQGLHRRGIAHEIAEGCHTDQHGVLGGGARGRDA